MPAQNCSQSVLKSQECHIRYDSLFDDSQSTSRPRKSRRGRPPIGNPSEVRSIDEHVVGSWTGHLACRRKDNKLHVLPVVLCNNPYPFTHIGWPNVRDKGMLSMSCVLGYQVLISLPLLFFSLGISHEPSASHKSMSDPAEVWTKATCIQAVDY